MSVIAKKQKIAKDNSVICSFASYSVLSHLHGCLIKTTLNLSQLKRLRIKNWHTQTSCHFYVNFLEKNFYLLYLLYIAYTNTTNI